MLQPGTNSPRIWHIFVVCLTFFVLCESFDYRRYKRSPDTDESAASNKKEEPESSENESTDKPIKREKEKPMPQQPPPAKGGKSESGTNENSAPNDPDSEHGNLLSTRALALADFEPEEDKANAAKFGNEEMNSEDDAVSKGS